MVNLLKVLAELQVSLKITWSRLLTHGPPRVHQILLLLLLPYRWCLNNKACVFYSIVIFYNLNKQPFKISESPANSPGGGCRRGSESNGSSRSRDRSICVVPSPLATSCTLEDIEGDFASATAKSSNNFVTRERKDFSRLFVPIPPSPGAMDCCTTDVEESSSVSKNLQESITKELSAPSMFWIYKLLGISERCL